MSSLGDLLRDNMLACPWKANFHIECPGCGFQTALAFLLDGDIRRSLEAYPALLLILAMFVYTGLHLRFRFKKGHKVLIGFFALNCAIIFSSFFIKLF